MADFPIPLDNLITYVKHLHADGDALDNLSDAVLVSTRLDEQADSLIGHFVDQARRSGASWSQIGASMGVTKQAAQQRFVPRATEQDDSAEKLFSRFTQRARNALGAAARIAAGVGTDRIGGAHIAVGLLSEPEGLAARILHTLGVGDDELAAMFELAPVASQRLGADGLDQLRYSDDGKAVLRGTMKAVLRLGHNYVGTEHLLLGVLYAEGKEAGLLAARGVQAGPVEAALAEETSRIRAERGM